MAEIRVGVSGWTFPGWRGEFYPEGLVQKKELHHLSRQLNSVEINGTFYSLQKPDSFTKWHNETPDDFRFAVKGPQYITHIRRLKDVQEPLCNYMASGLLCLREKMGPLLWQFPPNVTLKDDRFEKFLELLPYDSKAAVKLAKQHTDKVKGRSFTDSPGDFEIRHAFEFRHKSFNDPEFLKLLKKFNVAAVFAHSGVVPEIEEQTADFVYCRMHGQEPKYKKGYAHENKTLTWLAKQIKVWTPKKDVFVYFDTDEKEYAPGDALKLSKILGILPARRS